MSMRVLAIETATSRGSIALVAGKRHAESVCIGERFEHSVTLVPKIQELLHRAQLGVKDLDLVCVSKGPGSFTGLRVGIACSKGIVLGLDIPLLGVSTFEVLLAGFLRDPLCPLNHIPEVKSIVVALDAKKGEFFLQCWRQKGSRWTAQRPQVVEEAHLSAGIARYGKKAIVVSPQLSKLRGILRDPMLWDIKDRFPDAADLVSLGVERFKKERKGDDNLKPFYLRKTDAELLFKNKPHSVFRWERGN